MGVVENESEGWGEWRTLVRDGGSGETRVRDGGSGGRD